jgi:hypothetical protein
VTLPLGRVAAEALKLRGTMWRVQQEALAAAAAAAAAAEYAAGSASALPLLLALPPAASASSAAAAVAGAGVAAVSADVVEQQEVEGVGRFTAYADGRVRAVFADRTILGLGPDRAAASLILPDGRRREVPVAALAGSALEGYVQVCVCVCAVGCAGR